MNIIDVCRKLHANETQEQCYDLRQNKMSEQRFCRSSARTHTWTRTMLPDTLRRTLAYGFQQISFAIPFAIRYAGFVL